MSCIVAIYNPICGDGTARAFFADHVFPLLERHQRKVDVTIETEYAGHAGVALADILLKMSGMAITITVILGSGDGTLHEIINHLCKIAPASERQFPTVNFAIVPCGTANALFSSFFPPEEHTGSIDSSYRCCSLQSFFDSGKLKPLTLATSTISSPAAHQEQSRTSVSAVVTSTSLHASILNDSEQLRAENPTIERFKIAARQNSTKWYSASVKLLPLPRIGAAQIYDRLSRNFVDYPTSKTNLQADLTGPFLYFLSTVNVDRLEPAFMIAPLATAMPNLEGACDLIIVRPQRDPSIEFDTQKSRDAFVPKIWKVLGGAYEKGSHVNFTYDEDGSISDDVSGGLPVVEYFRCGGWEWIPDNSDPGAHLLCSDGTILHVEKGGKVVCMVGVAQPQWEFAVYV